MFQFLEHPRGVLNGFPGEIIQLKEARLNALKTHNIVTMSDVYSISYRCGERITVKNEFIIP